MSNLGFRSPACYMGHVRTPENTRTFTVTSKGKKYVGRVCKICERARRPKGSNNAPSSRMVCPQGHPYAGENLLLRPGRKPGTTWRRCRKCDRTHHKNSVARWLI